MSNETDAYEVDTRHYRELGHHMDKRYQVSNSGSTKFINAMLSLIVGLAVAAFLGMWGMHADVAEMKGETRATREEVNALRESINLLWKSNGR